jgi:hypothetical protein
MTADVQNVTSNQLQSLGNNSETFSVLCHPKINQICELYLRREDEKYYIHLLGKNGEP